MPLSSCSQCKATMAGLLLGFLCYIFVDINAGTAADGVTRTVSDDIYMDPCKASIFSGDIALSDDEAAGLETSLHRDRILIESEIERQMNSLTNQKTNTSRDLEAAKLALHDLCDVESQVSTSTETDCLSVHRELHKTRQRLQQLTDAIRDLKTKSRNLKQIVEQSHSRRRRAATAIPERLWTHGVVPYVIGGNFTGRTKALFQMAMRHWENHTCITFREKEPDDKNYITFTVKECGCCSYVGMKGSGSQAISIGKNCDKFGIVVHELGHVIGFWHEHTRPDRDEHVKILRENIQEKQEYNFDKMTYADINSLGEPYDYGSIMHYSRNTFAKKGLSVLDTIVPRRKNGSPLTPDIGQRVMLSEGDIRQANKLYKCPLCGKTLQDTTGEFSHKPIRGKRELCQWRISATHGEKIVLNITMLDLYKTHDCRMDYLEVRDGPCVTAPLLGRFCGKNLPDTLESTGTRMWIEFRATVGQGEGFKANYEAMCGGEIKKEEGFLSSPNFPEDYKANKDCAWKIVVPEGFTVALQFQNFNIEKHDTCSYDHLEIRDGPDESSELIKNLCGFNIPDDIQSTGNTLYVRFVSDTNVQKGGFSATFVKEYDECATIDHGCDQICENTLGSYKCSCRFGYELHADGRRCLDACGGYLDSENGTIESPSYPDIYPPNKNCIWEIVASKEHKIHLTFTHFDVEGTNQDCEYDSVKVSSSVNKNLKHHGTFCGTALPAPVTSEANKIHIEFNSDNSLQRTGFVIQYQTDKDECSVNNGGCQHICQNTLGSYHCECNNGFTLHDNNHDCKEGGCIYEITKSLGMVHSPNFPEDYPSRKDCSWHFVTEPGQRVRLTFKTFELEPHRSCTYDHVNIFDGPDSHSKSLAKLCGATIPKPVVSSGRDLYMTFFSDVSVERKGFEVEHDTVCGGTLIASRTPQTFVSHAQYGDLNYGNEADCDWRIVGPRNTVVLLDFQAMDIEEEYDCGYDYVTVFDGLYKSNRTIGTYCGDKIPDQIRSTSKSMLVEFKSDGTIVLKGFKATYRSVPIS